MNYLIIALLVVITVDCQMSDFYNPTTSRSMLYYAKAAYCDKSQIQSWNGQACEYHPNIKSISVINNIANGAQLYTAYDPDENAIIIAVRGSQNIQNWINNLDYAKTDYPYCSDCKVHSGFFKFWNAVQDDVLAEYKSLKASYPKAKTYVTGHSLGAAVATLCALELKQQGYNIDTFYIFGCPRVGNQEFSEYGAKQLPYEVEVIHFHDPVPHLPLAAQGFVRIPTECYYNSATNDSSYKWCPSVGGKESTQCSDKLLLATDIQDHLHYLGVYTGCTDIESTSTYMENEMYQYQVGTGLQKYAMLEQLYKLTEEQNIPDDLVTSIISSFE